MATVPRSAQWRSSTQTMTVARRARASRNWATASRRRKRSSSGATGRGLTDVGKDLAQGGHQLRQSCGPRAEVGPQLDGVKVRNESGEGVDEGGVGGAPLALETAAEDHQGTLVFGPLRELLQEAGLADARLAGDHDHPAVAGGGLGQRGEQSGQFGFPTDDGDPGDVTGLSLCQFGMHLAGGHRLRDAFEGQLAQVGEGELAPAGQEAGHRLGAEDLASVGPVAQSSGDDDRSAEVVGGVAEGLPGVETHPDGQAFAGNRTPGGLLHGHGSTQGVESGGEGDHQPVPQPLDLLAAVGRRPPRR